MNALEFHENFTKALRYKVEGFYNGVQIGQDMNHASHAVLHRTVRSRFLGSP